MNVQPVTTSATEGSSVYKLQCESRSAVGVAVISSTQKATAPPTGRRHVYSLTVSNTVAQVNTHRVTNRADVCSSGSHCNKIHVW